MLKLFELDCGHIYCVKEGGRIPKTGEKVRCQICDIEDSVVITFRFAC